MMVVLFGWFSFFCVGSGGVVFCLFVLGALFFPTLKSQKCNSNFSGCLICEVLLIV